MLPWRFTLTSTVGFVLSILAMSSQVEAVNLVPNSSFTNVYGGTPCPDYYDQLDRSDAWLNPNKSSPDYFHSCATQSEALAPTSLIATQPDANANEPATAYAGVYAYTTFTGPGRDTREYVEAVLREPMVAGHVYFVSFVVSPSEGGKHVVEDFGAWIGYVSSGPLPTADASRKDNILRTPQITNTNGMLDDTTRWTQISGYYQAQGGEDRIVIGNFESDVSTTATNNPGFDSNLSTSNLMKVGYYLIDDVVVQWACGSPLDQLDYSPLEYPGGGTQDLGCYYFDDPWLYQSTEPGSLYAQQTGSPGYAGKGGIAANATSSGTNGLNLRRTDGSTFDVCSISIAEGPDEAQGLAPGETDLAVGRNGGALIASQVVFLDQVAPYEEVIKLSGFTNLTDFYTLGETDYQWTGLCACESGQCDCVEPHLDVVNHRRRYCIDGESNGTGFSWMLSPSPGVLVDVPPADVPAGIGPHGIARAFANSLQAAGVKAFKRLRRPCFVIRAPPSTIQLEVGPFGGPTNCVVTGNPAGCTFNPTIYEELYYPPAPGQLRDSPIFLPSAGMGALAGLIGLLGASGGWLTRRRRAA